MMSELANVTWDEVESAQDASKMLLRVANSHPANIGMGALIMATSVAASEMNIPLENIAAMFNKTLTEVYACAGRLHDGRIVN